MAASTPAKGTRNYLLLPVLCMTAGTLLRLWFILRHATIQNDSSLYQEIAQNWVRFHTYGFSTETWPRPTLIRLPGYPIFLVLSSVLTGHGLSIESFGAVFFLQALLDLAACWLIAATARNLTQRFAPQAAPRVFLLTLALACLCPFTANYVATPLTESPVIFTVAAALWALERWLQAFSNGHKGWRYLVALSLALGYSILLRPDQALLAAALLPAMLYAGTHPTSEVPQRPQPTPIGQPVILEDALEQRLERRSQSRLTVWPQGLRLRATGTPALLALLLTLLPLVPWTIRNAVTFHIFQPLAPKSATDPGEPVPSGFQHWYRTWAADFASTEEFYWKYPDEELDISRLPDRAFDSDAEYDQTDQLLDDSNNLPQYHAGIDARFAALAAQRIHADPLRYYVALPVARLANMLVHPRTEIFPYDLRWWQYRQHPRETWYAINFLLLNLAFYVAAFFGLRRCWGIDRTFTAAVLAYIALRCLLLLTLDNAEQRYTIEFYPILLVACGLLALPRRGASSSFNNDAGR